MHARFRRARAMFCIAAFAIPSTASAQVVDPARLIEVDDVEASHFTSNSASDGSPDAAIDGVLSTAWQAEHSDTGEWIELRLRNLSSVDKLGIVAGYDKYANDDFGDRWFKNHRAAEILIEYEGGSRRHKLADRRTMQWVTLDSVRTRWIRVRISKVYASERWNDVAISEIVLQAPPPPAPLPSVQAAVAASTPAASSTVVAPAPSAAVGEPVAPSLPERNPALAMVGLLGVLGIGGLAFAATRTTSSSRKRDAHLLRRAQAAMSAIQSDAAALGPLYAPVLTASERLLAIATSSMHHLAAARDALRRTQRLLSPGATEHRNKLLGQEKLALSRLTTLVERLEDTMAHLVSVRADRHSPHDVDEIISRLNEEVVMAVAAEEETCTSLAS